MYALRRITSEQEGIALFKTGTVKDFYPRVPCVSGSGTISIRVVDPEGSETFSRIWIRKKSLLDPDSSGSEITLK
jgi:hypothetical protein